MLSKIPLCPPWCRRNDRTISESLGRWLTVKEKFLSTSCFISYILSMSKIRLPVEKRILFLQMKSWARNVCTRSKVYSLEVNHRTEGSRSTTYKIFIIFRNIVSATFRRLFGSICVQGRHLVVSSSRSYHLFVMHDSIHCFRHCINFSDFSWNYQGERTIEQFNSTTKYISTTFIPSRCCLPEGSTKCYPLHNCAVLDQSTTPSITRFDHPTCFLRPCADLLWTLAFAFAQYFILHARFDLSITFTT